MGDDALAFSNSSSFFVSGSFSTRERVAESPSRKARVRLSQGGAEPRHILRRRVRNRRFSLRSLASSGNP